MKQILFLALCILCLQVPFALQASTDSISLAQEKQIRELTKNVDSLQKAVSTISTQTAKEKAPLSGWQKVYILIPILLFLIIFFVIIIWLKRSGFKIGEAIQSDVPLTTTRINASGQQEEITVVDAAGNPVLPKSSSRFLALFSGFTAIIVSLSLVSYYAYFAMRGDTMPHFDNILEILGGLGIGVVPYAFNKFNEKK